MARRGVIELSDIEANAIFGAGSKTEFEQIVGIRIRRVTAPFTQRKVASDLENDNLAQPKLPGFES